MRNNEIVNKIKSNLTGNKEQDIAYLHNELRYYQSINNFDIAFQIQLLLFNYLSKEEKEKLNNDANNMLKEHKAKYEIAVEALNFGNLDKARNILSELFDVYEKVGKINGANFYDFSEKIEYFLYFASVDGIRNASIKKVPEPVIYYAYQIASIYLEENKIDCAIDYLKRALLFNPICQYILQELIDRLLQIDCFEEAYEYIKRSIKYAYTKKQLANAYSKLGIYYSHLKKYNKAIASFAVSNLYADDLDNKIRIKQIVDKVGQIKFKDADEIISLFKEEGINYGPSKEVINSLKEFIIYSKTKKDEKTYSYLIKIASELTDDESYFKNL